MRGGPQHRRQFIFERSDLLLDGKGLAKLGDSQTEWRVHGAGVERGSAIVNESVRASSLPQARIL